MALPSSAVVVKYNLLAALLEKARPANRFKNFDTISLNVHLESGLLMTYPYYKDICLLMYKISPVTTFHTLCEAFFFLLAP